MKIKLIREGGFIGLSTNNSIEFEDLSKEEQEAFTQALEETMSKEKAPESGSPKKTKASSKPQVASRGADLCNYEMKVKKGSKMVTVRFNDTTIPEKIYSIFEKYI